MLHRIIAYLESGPLLLKKLCCVRTYHKTLGSYRFSQVLDKNSIAALTSVVEHDTALFVNANYDSHIHLLRFSSLYQISHNFSTDKIYVGESQIPLDEYKIILNINLEGEMQND